MVSEEYIVQLCDEVIKTITNNNHDVRFFEIIAILGFIIFARNQCDYVCLEVGLGGKLDATNVVEPQNLICSAIVSIGMDHMDVLGDSKEEIAEEKAGVIKSGVTTVLGPTCMGLKSI